MENKPQECNSKKLGFRALTAVVFGMMVGTGLYNLPQNMASGGGPVAVAVAWLITAAGMMLLVATFKTLADNRPDLNAGIYQYTQEGFGKFAGFNIAWGYWLCTAFANIAYAVMLNDSFGAFIPSLLRYGWQSLLFGTLLIWGMFFIVASGINVAKTINNIMAVLKVVAILLAAVLLILNFRLGTFSINFFSSGWSLSDMTSQVKDSMLVTLWCFIGIEGAVMMSARAKRPSDIGKASVTGFFIAWVLYVLVSILCFGLASRSELEALENPSVAYLLRTACGEWAYWFVITSVIVALLGGWLAWTLVCAQVPYEAAAVGLFPKSFLRLNRFGMPQFGLAVSSVAMEAFLILVLTADDVYMAALNVSSMMVLPAYLMSGVFLWKISAKERQPDSGGKSRKKGIAIGIGCTAYCLWLIYAGGLDLLAFTSFFYIAGLGFYFSSRKERLFHKPAKITPADVATCALIAIGAIASIWLLSNGHYPI